MNESDTGVNERFSRSLEQALVVGVTNVVCYILKNQFGIEKGGSAKNPNALEEALKKIFGTNGIDFLEVISKEIQAEFHLSIALVEEDALPAIMLRKAHRKASSM